MLVNQHRNPNQTSMMTAGASPMMMRGPGGAPRHPSQLPPFQPASSPIMNARDFTTQGPHPSNPLHGQSLERLTPPSSGDPYCRPIALHRAQNSSPNQSPFYLQQQNGTDNGTANGMMGPGNGMTSYSPPPNSFQGTPPMHLQQPHDQQVMINKNGEQTYWLDTPPSICSSEEGGNSENACKRQRVSPTNSGGSSPLINSSGMSVDSLQTSGEDGGTLSMPSSCQFPSYMPTQNQQQSHPELPPFYGDFVPPHPPQAIPAGNFQNLSGPTYSATDGGI